MPAVALETFRRIVGEPTVNATVDRNAVVVVERDELAESERSCERARLVRDALHHAAFAVEFRGEQYLRDREPDGVGDALSERTGCGLDTRCHAEFRMPRRFRVE